MSIPRLRQSLAQSKSRPTSRLLPILQVYNERISLPTQDVDVRDPRLTLVARSFAIFEGQAL
ncbi:uncharacterized protein N7503_004248 [Penicillium pulvis]|uniref:uncharacterized protein n=1 Tax=Penicillium pulvis TaxID=1562058 RepID=UPI002547E343|nr:uncharacterized protein N7503_004248 [Penicillium pulvis]KAJ5806646.1 hypothetical protein N7503_004248 [Penicillium pulvis]